MDFDAVSQAFAELFSWTEGFKLGVLLKGILAILSALAGFDFLHGVPVE